MNGSAQYYILKDWKRQMKQLEKTWEEPSTILHVPNQKCIKNIDNEI